MNATTQPQTNRASPITIESLIGMTQAELDDLFKRSEPGPIPEGDSQGAAIVHPGSWWARIIRRLAYRFAWQGKVFTKYKCPNCGESVLALLENKITLVGVRAITARVYQTESWIDGKPCIVLDYSKTSFFARKIRDEIREVAPKLYLGKVWWGKTRLIDFALRFP
jgi:hypothetical protein